jgi:outer membrane lipoprotein-sorting protein
MTSVSVLRSRRARWAVPAVAAVGVISAGPLIDSVTADAHGPLPPRTPAQLLVDLRGGDVRALSGTVVESTNLGLPELPTIGGHGGDAGSFSALLSGSHTMRVWYDGPDRVRVALLGKLGESDLTRNGPDLWSWSSKANTATHWSVPTSDRTPMRPASPAGPALLPQQAAYAALKMIDPTTQVTSDPTATVAGRPAYELRLVPRDPRTLVGSVRIAIDGSTHIPTRVQVFARGSSGLAFEVGFTSFSTSTPAAGVFAFHPPPGATVKQGSLRSRGTRGLPLKGHFSGAAPNLVGHGWTSVLVAHLQSDAGSGSGSLSLDTLLGKLPAVSGSWGTGHLFRSTLLSAVLTDDGRVASGAVPPQMLYDALSRR